MPIDVETLATFCAATALLVATPGPMVAFIIATALSRGLRFALAAVAGSTAASAIHLIVVAFGLTAILSLASSAFFWLKWAGALYLLYLGVRALRQPAADDLSVAQGATSSIRRVMIEGFLVNLTNPKALLFHGAFLPLFIKPDAAVGPQIWVLALAYLIVALVIDCLWGVTASRARPFVARVGRWRHRITGGVLITAALGMASLRKAT